nr:hypothetical protein [Tanacetum cinerariifolium]
MKMEHYLCHTDYPIWQVIKNGNGPVSITTDTNGMIKVLPPKTAEEVVAKERERKARTTLLMALPEDHLATDNRYKWHDQEGLHKGYDMFQTLLSQLEIHGAGVSHEDANQKFLRSLPSSWSQVALIVRTKPGLDTLSFDDLYNNLRVFKRDIKGTTASSSSNIQNVAFVFADNTSSTNTVSIAYSVSSLSVSKSQQEGYSSYTDEVIHSFFANQSSAPQLDCDDLEQINDDDLEDMDLKCRRREGGYNENKARDNGRRPAHHDDSKALVTMDGEDIDWSGHVKEDTQNFAMMAYSSSNSEKGHAWMYDLDYLTISMNYEHVSLENQANKSAGPQEANNSAGTQANDDQGTNSEEIDLHDKHFVLHIWSAYSTTIKSSRDKIEKNEKPDKGIINSGYSKHMTGNKAHLVDYQEFKSGSVAFGGSNGRITGKEKIKAGRLDFEDVYYVEELKHYNLFSVSQMCDKKNKSKLNFAEKGHAWMYDLDYLTNSMNYEYVSLENQANKSAGPQEANNSTGTQANDDQGTNSEEIDLHDKHFVLHIWKEATHDTHDANTNSTNLLNVVSAPVSIVGMVTDFNNLETTMNVSPTPTTRIHTIHPKTQILRDPMSVVQTRSKVKKNFEAHALISQALKDESWVDAMQEELMQFKIQKEEGIDYDEVFSSVARIEAIRIFLAFAFYIGFIVYQMDVKSAFLYDTIDEEVYVTQPPRFVDPKFPNKFYKVVKALYGLHQAPRACVNTASTLIETQKPLVKDEEAADVDVHLYRSMIGSLMYLAAFRPDIMDAYEKKLIQVLKIHTDENVNDLLMKAFDVSSKELASPKQTALGKYESNLLIVDSLLKTIWSTMHHVIAMKHWLFQGKRQLQNPPRVKDLNKYLIFSMEARSDMRSQQVLSSAPLLSTCFGQRPSALVLKPHPRMNLAALWHQQSSVLPQTRSLTSPVDHQLGDMSHHQDVYDNPSVTKKVFANMKRVVPTEPSTSIPHKKHKSKKRQPKATKVPNPESSPEHQLPSPSNNQIPTAKGSWTLQELMDLCTRLSNKVMDLKSKVIDIKSSFTNRIQKLEERVDQLEVENRPLKEKSFKTTQVDTAAPVENMEKSFKQGRMIANMDKDVEEELVEVEEVLEVVKAAKLFIK